MAFFNSAIDVLQTLVIALGAGLGIWGVINLLEGYGNDNPGAKSQGMKQLSAASAAPSCFMPCAMPFPSFRNAQKGRSAAHAAGRTRKYHDDII